MPGRKKVLIIDYEPRGIMQLREPLEQAGYLVEVAKDGLSGIHVFESSRPDLTLIEAMLPKKHGFEVCQELKRTAHGALTPIVIVTSVYKGRKYRTQALHNYGCDEYLEKPIPGDKLLETVRRLIAQRRGTAPPAEAPGPSSEDHVAGDRAESEIMARLDQIMPDDSASTLGSSPSSARVLVEAPATDEKVVSFDPDRPRKRRTAPVQAASGAVTPSISSRGAAEPASVEAIREPRAMTAPASSVQADPAPRQALRPREAHPAPRAAWWVWVLLALLLFVASGVLYLLVFRQS